MPGFTQVFGGTTIYPSDVSYLALALTADETLEWPLERSTDGNLVASIIDITPTGAYAITLPSAMLTGVGQTVLFNNLGPSTVTIKGNAGATLLSLAAGEVWQIYLTDNTTAAGSWRSFKYGASIAQAQASALAGYGIVAIGSTLAQTSTVNSTAITPQSLGAPDRASTYLWIGGLGTFNLPSAVAVGNGWFVNIRNSGTGDLVLDPAGVETINGGLTLTLAPGDSAVVATDGLNWYTIGLGQQAIFAFDYTSISLAGLGNPSAVTNYVLSGTELNRIAYTFTGTPLGDINIVVPFTVQQYWVANSTGGSYILSISTLGGTTAQINQNARSIYYCTGSQIVKADTSTGLPIPVGIGQGGTGATTATDALTNLGGTAVGKAMFTAASESAARAAILAAASGVNGDIEELVGLTTPLSVAQGGTGLTSPGTNGYVLTSNGTAFVMAEPAGGTTTFIRSNFVATGGQTSFAFTYTPPYVMVWVNGVFQSYSDYTATSGTAVVLTTACVAGDLVEFITFAATTVANTMLPDFSNATATNAVAFGGTSQTTVAGVRNAYGIGVASRKTANYTAVAGDYLACDTIAVGAFTVTLPASPAAGDKPIVIFDAGTTTTVNGFATNNLTVARNGNTIHTLAEDAIISTKGVCVTFEYINGTWRIRVG